MLESLAARAGTGHARGERAALTALGRFRASGICLQLRREAGGGRLEGVETPGRGSDSVSPLLRLRGRGFFSPPGSNEHFGPSPLN